MTRFHRGILITFEGCDGGGKTTQLRLLAERFKQTKRTFLTLREPGGTDIGETVRSILLQKKHSSLCSEAELLLFEAARAQLVHEVIRPALNEGKVVLCDRFMDSTTAYQGAGRHLSLKAINVMNAFATGDVRPNMTFLLDVPPGVSRQRVLQRTFSDLDRMEGEELSFYERVREGYLCLAATHPERIVVIDACRDKQEIADFIWEKVQCILPTDE
jgi:dTMP kinase